MVHITPMTENRTFSWSEVKEVLPALKRMTMRTVAAAEKVMAKYGPLTPEDYERNIQEELLLAIVQKWMGMVRRFGACPDGAWIVTFQTEDGYFRWRYEEDEISLMDRKHQLLATYSV